MPRIFCSAARLSVSCCRPAYTEYKSCTSSRSRHSAVFPVGRACKEQNCLGTINHLPKFMTTFLCRGNASPATCGGAGRKSAPPGSNSVPKRHTAIFNAMAAGQNNGTHP